MSSERRLLGTMRPLGGGDPVPLKKEEMLIGRRPTCDVQLNFENVSSKHCVLRFIQGAWHVRDLGSTNGTTVNGQRITSEHGLMPDDELGVATHLFMIDYEPNTLVFESNQVLEDELAGTNRRARTSLMELAGLGRADDEPRPPGERPARRPDRDASPAADEPALVEDELPSDFRGAAAGEVAVDDDDFFRMIEDDVRKD